MTKLTDLKVKLLTLCIVFGVVAGSGCSNIGMSPAGASQDEAKAAYDKLPVEERAKQLMALPGTQADKLAKVKAMYEKEGKTMPENFGTPAAGVPGGLPAHG